MRLSGTARLTLSPSLSISFKGFTFCTLFGIVARLFRAGIDKVDCVLIVVLAGVALIRGGTDADTFGDRGDTGRGKREDFNNIGRMSAPYGDWSKFFATFSFFKFDQQRMFFPVHRERKRYLWSVSPAFPTFSSTWHHQSFAIVSTRIAQNQ